MYMFTVKKVWVLGAFVYVSIRHLSDHPAVNGFERKDISHPTLSDYAAAKDGASHFEYMSQLYSTFF